MSATTKGNEMKLEIYKLIKVLEQLSKGEIPVPLDCCWSGSKVISLLDSVKRQYPIGSLTFSNRNLGSEREIIDGRCRIRALFDAFCCDKHLVYNAEDDVFEYLKSENTSVFHFPVNKTLDTIGFLAQSEMIKKSKDSRVKKWIENIEDFIKVVFDYKISVITVKNLSVEEVEELMCRLNR